MLFYNGVYIWSCDFIKLLKMNNRMKQFKRKNCVKSFYGRKKIIKHTLSI